MFTGSPHAGAAKKKEQKLKRKKPRARNKNQEPRTKKQNTNHKTLNTKHETHTHTQKRTHYQRTHPGPSDKFLTHGTWVGGLSGHAAAADSPIRRRPRMPELFCLGCCFLERERDIYIYIYIYSRGLRPFRRPRFSLGSLGGSGSVEEDPGRMRPGNFRRPFSWPVLQPFGDGIASALHAPAHGTWNGGFQARVLVSAFKPP